MPSASRSRVHRRRSLPCGFWPKASTSRRRNPLTRSVSDGTALGHTFYSAVHPRFAVPLAELVRRSERLARPGIVSYVERTGSSNAARKGFLFRPASKFECSSAARFSSRPKEEAALFYHGQLLLS